MDGGQITGLAGWDTSPATGKGSRPLSGPRRVRKEAGKAQRSSDPVKVNHYFTTAWKP